MFIDISSGLLEIHDTVSAEKLAYRQRSSHSANHYRRKCFRRAYFRIHEKGKGAVPNRYWLRRPAAPRVCDRVKKDCRKSFRGSLPKRIRKRFRTRRCVALERIFGDPVVADDSKREPDKFTIIR